MSELFITFPSVPSFSNWERYCYVFQHLNLFDLFGFFHIIIFLQAITDLLQRLVVANSEKISKTTSMDNRVSDMSKLAFEGVSKDQEQKVKITSFVIRVKYDMFRAKLFQFF
uniref:Uncharacterized protein n=1 Tax=Heterorhabditis bacteriophora TaxID=37862 RepID=A0A1I7XGI9_HETBA